MCVGALRGFNRGCQRLVAAVVPAVRKMIIALRLRWLAHDLPRRFHHRVKQQRSPAALRLQFVLAGRVDVGQRFFQVAPRRCRLLAHHHRHVELRDEDLVFAFAQYLIHELKARAALAFEHLAPGSCWCPPAVRWSAASPTRGRNSESPGAACFRRGQNRPWSDH